MAASTSILSKNNKMLGRFLSLSFSFLCLVPQAFGAAAVAIANTSEGIVYYQVRNQPTQAKAREQALRRCREDTDAHGPCSIKAAANGPNYWAFVHGSDGSVGFGWSPDRQEAIDQAYAQCQQLTRTCSNEAKNVWYDEGQGQKVAPAPAQSGSCTPPPGKVVHSQYVCNGGDCVRRFENGCTVRFQAPNCYDPVQQKWEWKPNGC